MSNRLPLHEVESLSEFLTVAEKHREMAIAALYKLSSEDDLDLSSDPAKDYRPNKYDGD